MVQAMNVCPLCMDNVDFDTVFSHLLDTHPLFMAIVNSMYLPLDDYADASYEEMVNLCDEIGNVEVGVEDIDAVTSVIVTERSQKENPCPICLENMPSECDYVRKINTCNHRFCGKCIEKWLGSHKTCPVCKSAVDQIASTLSSNTINS